MKVLLEIDDDADRELVDQVVRSIEDELELPVALLDGERGFRAHLDEVLLLAADEVPAPEAVLERLRTVLGLVPVQAATEADFEPVVVQPSRRMFAYVLAACMFAIGLGVFLRVTEARFRPLRPLWPPEAFIGIGVLLPLLMWLQRGRRIVVTRDTITEFRDGHEVVSVPARSIERFGFSWIGRTLVFAGGARIAFNELWENGDWLKSSFGILIDARRGNLHREGNWVTLDFLRFPDRCLACGSTEHAPRRIFVGYRIIAGLVAYWHGEPVFVPSCQRCRRRHRTAYLVTLFVALPILIALAAGVCYAVALGSGDGAAIATGFALFLAGSLILPNLIPVLLDTRFLGVGGASVRNDKRQAWLHFKNRALRDEVLGLADEAQMEHLHAAALYLKEQRPPS